MIGILLWLAETVGGVALRHWLEGLLGQKPAPDPQLTAQASRATAQAAQDEQIIKSQEVRSEVDQTVGDRGAATARDDMRQHWNEP